MFDSMKFGGFASMLILVSGEGLSVSLTFDRMFRLFDFFWVGATEDMEL